MNNRYRIIVAVILALGSIIAISKSSDKDCINVYVDYNNLEMSTFDKCLPVTSDIKAIDLLKNNNFTLQGTEKYGDAVVCRLNGLPTAKDESCQDMPSDKAYWAILEKKKQLINIPFMENGYSWAQVGISELILSPGDSLALVFAKDGEVKFPE
jgi:hypothetical protein